MKVKISLLQRELILEVGCQEPVIEIKRKIEQQLGIPIASQTLLVYEWELLDGLDMEDYPIVTEGTKIDLVTGFSQPRNDINEPSKIRIIVNISSRQHRMEVEKTETVRSLKEKIATIEGTTTKAMSLFFGGRELADEHRNLTGYGIGDWSEIIVFYKATNCVRHEAPSRRLSIVVQTSSSLLNGTSIPVEMSDSSSVSDLRHLLLSRKILPLDDYLFIHRQRVMKNSCSLKWHGVEDGDFLYVFKGTVTRGEF